MTPLAIVLAALAAFGYAIGARQQHRAVRDTTGGRGLGARDQLRLLRNRQWLLGLAMLGCGVVSHASALGLAPLSVVQPIGVLALPLTVLISLPEHGTGLRGLNRTVVLAVVASTGGVGAFVVLAAGSATATPVAAQHEVLATQLVAGAVLVCGIVGLFGHSKARCVAFATGCAVAYGLVSLLVRAVVQQLGGRGLTALEWGPVLGIITAVLVGGWLLQHAYASGPPDLVVACLTVVDPLVAVGLGIGLLGEADKVGPGTAVGEFVCAAVACAGVFALAKYHPDTQHRRVRSVVTGQRDLGEPSSIERPDGSTT